MVECQHSAFLEGARPLLRGLIAELHAADGVDAGGAKYDYVSVLATDDSGVSYHAARGETGASDPMWVQRGFVVRAQRNGRVAEAAFNELPEGGAAGLAAIVRRRLDALLAAPSALRIHGPLPDLPARQEYRGSVALDPFAANPESVLERLAACRDALLARPDVASVQAFADFVKLSRLFISPTRELTQSLIWTQDYLFGVIRRGDQAKTSYRAVSGLKGLEALPELEAAVPELSDELRELLDAVRIEPGEHDVILAPDMAGTLAHEAFGHGVETDMFVKRRARARDYIGKAVASPIVTMYDGAAGVAQTGSFLFDDEGNLGMRTLVIDKGILVSGFSDALSALDLGISATGNGRRQSYDHKAYARMTNTYFAPGDSTLGEMIASTKRGWLLDRLDSGMEDPRNWGIQLIALVGREIVDGRLTGRVASPVYCSGYVPDVLGAITMLSRDFELGGSGACGKGHKEFVKVSSGGPYVKTRMRLG